MIWSARFKEPVATRVQEYSASVRFDQRLALVDIQGSLAHAEMLNAQGILSDDDWSNIQRGLQDIRLAIESGRFEWLLALEDVHLNIEKRLTDNIGDAGKRLHTGRSRNDQVATDSRLWLRGIIDEAIAGIIRLQTSLLDFAQQHVHTIMPGYTHLQVAQPISFAHHLLAYVEMLFRDADRLREARRRTNQLPLGAAALAGTSYPIDRARVAKTLGFEGLCRNSLDAVSDRDFALDFSYASALLMMHLSRLSEELINWCAAGFIEIADRFCTGSSIMPQKKNPDIPELVRGKTGRVYGHLFALLTLMKAQPLAYNKDNQEDKEALFDTADTVLATLNIYSELLGAISVNKTAMYQAANRGYATATDLADYLVKKGMPFRDAHEVVSRVVRYAVDQQLSLMDISLTDLQQFSPLIDTDALEVLSLEGSINSRNHRGGTAPSQVEAAILDARQQLAQ